MVETIVKLATGVLFLVVGIAMFLKQRREAQNCTASVSAEVTDYVTEIENSGDPPVKKEVYYPVMRYWANSRWYEQKSSVGSGKQKYAIGDHAEILYDPDKPESFIFPGDRTNLLMSVAFTLAGAALLIMAFLSI